MIESGTTLQQRYTIDKQIGQGGMGAVYVATDSRFGSTVAIKETLCMDDNFRKAIEREARLLNSLKHSALPRVSDHFEESDGQFLVMEYIPGDDVATILERDQKPFSAEQVVTWADQLLDALDYLHNQEMPVIHRDIKPQNLKITPRGQIILLDFGLAKGNPTDASHQTAAKSIFGYSKSYASLEQIQGTGTDPRSDLYSLGATLYHLATNVAPEDALTRAMSVLGQNPDPLVPANVVNPAIPRGVAGILQKALDLNASERPSSAAEMRQMLRDSENYAYLADAVTVPSLAVDTQDFSQPTKLMRDPVKQSDVKTEIMSANASELTAIRSGDVGAATNVAPAHVTAAPAEKRGGSGMAVGAAIVLLVGAAIAGGIYVVKPSVFGAGPEKTDVGTALPAANANATANANTAPAQTGLTATNSANAGLSDTTHQAETTKNKTTGTEKSNTTSATSDPNTTATGGVVGPERPAPGTNPYGPPPNQMGPPPPAGQDPPPRGFDPSKLTPQQRQRLQRMMRNGQPRQPGNHPNKQPPN